MVFFRRVVILALIAVSRGICAADAVPTLSTQDAVALALRNNPLVETSALQHIVDQYSLKLAYYDYAPQYHFSAGMSDTHNASVTKNSALGSTWHTTSGLQLATDYQLQENGSVLDQSVSLQATLPLLKGSGYAINTVPLANAQEQAYINRLAYQDSIASVIDSVQAQYFKVVADYQQLDVYHLAVQRSQNTLKEYQLKVKSGDLPSASIAQQQAQLTKDQLQLNTHAQAIKNDYRDLMILLGLPVDTRFTLDKTIDISHVHVPKLEDALALAQQNNYAYQQQLVTVQSLKRSLAVAQDNTRVQLDVSASVSSDGERQAGIKAIVPIADMTLDYQVVSARIAYQQAQINLKNADRNLVADVTNAVNDLESLRQQITLSEENAHFAKQNYDNTQLGYLHGKSSAFEVVAQMQAYLESQIAVIQYRMQYATNFAALNKLLGHTLAHWHVRLAE